MKSKEEIAIAHSESVDKPFKGTIEDWTVLWGKVLGTHLERNITTSFIKFLTPDFVETKNSVYALGKPVD